MHDETTTSLTRPANRRNYKCFTYDLQKWNRLVSTLIAVTEIGDFCKADKCIKEMETCLIPPYSPADWPAYVKDCSNRIARLRDPLNKDFVFRELLGIPSEPSDGEFVYDDRITKQVFDKLVELWRLQDCLLFRLRVSEDDLADTDYPKKVAHYCRADALSNILDEGLRLCSLSSANDPTEGKRFADFLGSEIAGKRDWDQEEPMLTMQCSFSSRIDDLNQFRLYGRDSGGAEGTGLCLVFNLGYFDTRGTVPVPTSDAVRHNESETAKNNEELLIQKGVDSGDNGAYLPLYWVLYYDSKRKHFYHTPCQRERPFHVTSDKTTGGGGSCYIYRDARNNQQGIQKLLERIRVIFSGLKELDAFESGWNLCVYLRHLIKDATFRDEQEMRLLKLCPTHDPEVEPLKGKGTLSTVYYPLFKADEFSPLDQIIAGPKVRNLRQLRELMRRKCSGAPRTHYPGKEDVIRSDVPLA